MTTNPLFAHLTGAPAPKERARQTSDGSPKERTKRVLPTAVATTPDPSTFADVVHALRADEMAIVIGQNVNGGPLANRMRPIRRYAGSDDRPTVKHEVATTHLKTGTDSKTFRTKLDDAGNVVTDDAGQPVGEPVGTYTDVPGLPWSSDGDGQPATVFNAAWLIFADGDVKEVKLHKKGERTFATAETCVVDIGGTAFSCQVNVGVRIDSPPSVSARIYQGGKAVETDAAMLAAAARAASNHYGTDVDTSVLAGMSTKATLA